MGAIVAERPGVADRPGGGADLVDDIVVVDDGSDRRHRRGGPAGPGPGSWRPGTVGGGKGQAMAVALDETDAELLVFLDADVENFGPHFVTGLLGPLLVDPARTTTWPS